MMKFTMSDGDELELNKVIAVCQKPDDTDGIYFLMDGEFSNEDLLFMLEGITHKILSEYINMMISASKKSPNLKNVHSACLDILKFIYDKTVKDIISKLIEKETSNLISQNKNLDEIVEELSNKNPDFKISGIDLTEMMKQIKEEKEGED